MSDHAFVFRAENHDEPGRKIPDRLLAGAVRRRLPFGKGPWSFRVLHKGVPVGPWEPDRRWRRARRRLVWLLRTLPAGDTVAIRSARGRDYHARVVKLPQTTRAEQAHAIALGLFGTPYVFAGENPREGLDCSGFVSWLVELVTDGEVVLPHAARLIQMDPHLVKTQAPEQMNVALMWFPNSRGIPETMASHIGFYDAPNRLIDTRSPADPLGYSEIDGKVLFFAKIPALEQAA